MPFFETVRKFLLTNKRSGDEMNSKSLYLIKKNQDPNHFWNIVQQPAEHRVTRLKATIKVEQVNEKDLENFVGAIEILRTCRHDNIISFYEAFFLENKLWIFTEFCFYGALDSYMEKRNGPLTENEIRSYCFQMCNALSFLHGSSITHGDIRARNILLATYRLVKLGGFWKSARNNSSTMEKRNPFVTPPYWMAPEMVAWQNYTYSNEADIWSLGITLIEFAQMRTPYHDIHPDIVPLKIQEAKPPGLSQPLQWSPQFNCFLSKCLEKTPKKRFSAYQLLQHPFLSTGKIELVYESTPRILPKMDNQPISAWPNNMLDGGRLPESGVHDRNSLCEVIAIGHPQHENSLYQSTRSEVRSLEESMGDDNVFSQQSTVPNLQPENSDVKSLKTHFEELSVKLDIMMGEWRRMQDSMMDELKRMQDNMMDEWRRMQASVMDKIRLLQSANESKNRKDDAQERTPVSENHEFIVENPHPPSPPSSH